ncbi:Dynamin-like GTPase that mediates homotypic ER fusion [Geranomyces variabilis]|uniref:Dynamin-like GTPase that mediates homotypic ER fusion n=1 Tax=Geranomyces variabilis TaxID=109894 RepID=A0AAD5XV48_9FUNG|nr:Dynamin-like GTPase that mediates homotypic ER fusion [Geranomyces variabilis]
MSQTVPDIDQLPNASANGRESSVTPADARLQAVNEAQEFSPDMLDYMKNKWNIANRGFDYNVVAVFGSQSTGKSTLLNRLFGTNFDVMDEVSRQQTTKGIWASKARDADVLVLDVEGTDGRERGEDQDFERKSALFSIAIAEVLIVNMWENQVGLYNGANMGLLKTVFEVNLQLFQQKGSPKTCLFFVIRDFTGVTPIENLAATLTKDLERIWAGLNKPPGKEASLISDFFEFNFAGLPHKVYAPENFKNEAEKLKGRFYDRQNPAYTFKPAFHKHIPADGFPQFAEAIWEKIVTNRDLDLPTQQQLLAQYRCDEIMRVAYDTFAEHIKKYRVQLESGKVLEGLGKETQQYYLEAIEAFDADGSRYNKEVYQKKRAEFKEKMATALHVYYVQQLRNLHKSALNLFNERLAERMKGDDSEFARKLNESRQEAMSYYSRIAEATKLHDADWDGDEYQAQFEIEIEEIATQKRIEAMGRVLGKLDSFITQSLVEPIEVLLNEGPNDVWKRIFVVFRETLASAERELSKQLAGFESSDSEITAQVQKMKFQAWELMQKTIKSEFVDVKVLERLRHRFEQKFRYDSDGIPRVWSAGDDIDGPFSAARDDADALSQLYAKINVPESELDPSIVEDERFDPNAFVVLSPARLQNLRDRFKREADLLFVEAKRSIVTNQVGPSKIFYLALCVLGWNELLAVLSNPYLTLAALLSAVAGYAIWRTGMTRPVLNVARATLKETATQISERTGLSIEGVVTNFRAGAVGQRLERSTSHPSFPVRKGRDLNREHSGDEVEMVPAGRMSEGGLLADRRRRAVQDEY